MAIYLAVGAGVFVSEVVRHVGKLTDDEDSSDLQGGKSGGLIMLR